jgi:hypothetical protein
MFYISSVYGGDTFTSLHGITRYTGLKNPDDQQPDWIYYCLVPAFSISNIGYRWLDVEKPEQMFFPKYNNVKGINTCSHEGQTGDTTGSMDVSEDSIVHRVPPVDDLTLPSNYHMYYLGEYYGYENVINSVNNIEAAIIFNPDLNFISIFKYRIFRTKIQSTETINDSWRVIKSNEYYDSVNNKGEIINLDTDGVDLLIEHKYALLVVKALSELEINESTVVALGNANIFNNVPIEIIPDNSGYVGTQSKLTNFRCKFGNIILDAQANKIFLYNKYKVDEITLNGMFNWFNDNGGGNTVTSGGLWLFQNGNEILYSTQFGDELMAFDLKQSAINEQESIDKPFNSIGYLVTYDEDNERLLITRHFNGEYDGYTISYYPKYKIFVSFHDYLPSMYLHNREGLYKIYNSEYCNSKYGLYKMNNSTTYGNFYATTIYNASIELCFASPYNVNKHTLSFAWSTESIVKNMSELAGTFDKAIVCNSKAHSNYITLVKQTFNSGNIRLTDGRWHFNNFKDVLKNKALVLLDDKKVEEVLYSTLDNADIITDWYNKAPFVDKFVILKLIFSEDTSNGIIINDVSITNRISGRL